jgi:hypothetical protein
MRLTWRDAVSTVLVFAGLTMAVSVVEGWGWPLLVGVQAGIIALGIAGVASCVFGSPLDRFSFTDPFALMTMVLAMALIGIAIVGGLITGAPEFLFVLMVVTGALWAMATVRHAVEGTAAAPAKRALG